MSIETLEKISNKNSASSAFGIELRGGKLAFDNKTIFEDLNFDMVSGQTTCLLGPSGVGKSSLLRLIAGISLEATAQSLEASDGLPISGRVAYMDQRDLLLPWLSAIDNVTLGARLRREPINKVKASSLLKQVGLADKLDAKPASLSVGMRQRVALARTLMEDRPLVLMDEPFSAVDVLTRLHLQNLAAELLAHKTVLLVTHDPTEALRLGHKIFSLRGQPASLSTPITPRNSPPRPVDDPSLHKLVAIIIRELAE